MRSLILSAVFLLAFASTSGAQSGDARELCTASLERVLAGLAPDWSDDRCDRVVLADVTRRLRAAAQVTDSARLVLLRGAAGWFRDPELFRAALSLARDRRAAEGTRKLGLHVAFGQVHPRLFIVSREPRPPPPARCGRDSVGEVTCVVSTGVQECLYGIGRRPGFVVDRPLPARLLRELQSLIYSIRDDGRAPAGLRRLARCMLEAQGDGETGLRPGFRAAAPVAIDDHADVSGSRAGGVPGRVADVCIDRRRTLAGQDRSAATSA